MFSVCFFKTVFPLSSPGYRGTHSVAQAGWAPPASASESLDTWLPFCLALRNILLAESSSLFALIFFSLCHRLFHLLLLSHIGFPQFWPHHAHSHGRILICALFVPSVRGTPFHTAAYDLNVISSEMWSLTILLCHFLWFLISFSSQTVKMRRSFLCLYPQQLPHH